jgi:dTDP-glucose 4,6-dehydratase/UDP-glucuronate decarboxylase
MRVLVTGAAGLVGSHLCDQLVAQGHDVLAVDNFITGRRQNIQHLLDQPGFRLAEWDVSQRVDDVPVDQVYHLASPASPIGYMSNPIATHLVNSVGTLKLLELARRQEARFLYTSTSEIYGNPQVHPQPESYFGNVNPVGPRSCYDESKRFGESISMEFVRQFGLDARIVRLFNVYGPRNDPNDGRVIPAFISAALRNEPLPIYGDGSQTRSLCYIDDLTRGLLGVMSAEGLAGEVVNLGNPDERTVLELADRIAAICGSTAGYTWLPMRQDDPERRCPDITKARSHIGWEPEVTLEEGLRATVDYFANVERISA